MNDTMPLPDQLNASIKQLCADGYRLYDKREFKPALRKFYKALTLIPSPPTKYAEAGWVLTAIGDCYYRTHQWDQGRQALATALRCPGVSGNPFVHLRIGQCLLELKLPSDAAEHLELAYLNGGSKIFRLEAPKYLICAMQQIIQEEI